MANITVPFNASSMSDLPPLPAYTLKPVEPLLPWMSDVVLASIAPAVGYWILSMIFHYIDVNDMFPQYRLHTPAEILKRNHVSRTEVARNVIMQQLIQASMGLFLSMFDEEDLYGKEDYDVARWAIRIRLAQRILPQLLGILGLDSMHLSSNLSGSHPMLAGLLAGGKYPSLRVGMDIVTGSPIPTFASWEMSLAKAIYWIVIPALRMGLAIFLLDTWQYFCHRGMHMNKWLYTKIHAQHHRLYVPYAYGALYSSPVEGFIFETLGAGLTYKLAGLTPRQGLVFFVGGTMKTVDDHSGYAFPWDPLQHISSNNAAYHDIHHQSWGIKTNFSQPFLTFWDRMLGTIWSGGDTTARYERNKAAAQFKLDADKVEL